MSDGPATDTAQTYGWDTVFAVHIGDVNAAIVAAKTSPTEWTQADTAEGYSASGTFSDWSIVPGGSGDLVRLCLPLSSVTVNCPSGQEQASGTATADIRLDLLHDADNANLRLLKVATTSAGDGIPVASVVAVTFTGTQPSFLAGVAVKQLLQDWLNANLGSFDHVFCTVELNRAAASGAFQWMQPTDLAYAYTDLGVAGTDGALGILAMTQGRSSAGLVQQLSSVCIPSGQRASFMISQARVMDQLLLPAMPLTFSGTKATDFAVSPTGESIINADQTASFTVTANGKTSTATVVALTATINGTELVFDCTTTTEVSPGVHVYTRTISNLVMGLGPAAGGQGQTLVFSNANQPGVTHWNETDEGIVLTEEILGLIAVAFAAAAAVMTGGAALGAVALVVGLVAGVMMLTVQIIEWADANGAPAINAAVLDATAAITWQQGSGLTLSQAGLSDSLQLSGTLTSGG